MSVRSTAEEKIYEARKHVREAMEALTCIVVSECEGSDQLGIVTSSNVRSAMRDLMEVQATLSE